MYTLLIARTNGMYKVAVNSSVTPPVFGRPHIMTTDHGNLYQIVGTR